MYDICPRRNDHSFMNKKALVALSALLGIAALMAAVIMLRRGGDHYTKVIPADADVVMRLNLPDLAQQSGMMEDENVCTWQQMLSQQYPALSFMQKMLTDPSKLGLRIDHPIYAWFNAERCEGGACVEMYSVDDFCAALESSAKENGQHVAYDKDGDLTWVLLGDGKEYGVAFNKAALYMSIGAQPRKLLKQWLEADEHFDSSEGMNRLNESQDCLTLYASATAIPARYRLLLPQTDGLNDIYAIAALNPQKGSASLRWQAFSENEETQSQLDSYARTMTTMTGYYAQTAPDDCGLWMGFHLNAKNYLEPSQSLPILSQAESLLGVSLESALEDLDGDVALTAVPAEDGMASPTISLQMQVEGKDKLNTMLDAYLPEPLRSLILRPVANNQYVVSVPMMFDAQVRLGQADGTLFVTNGRVEDLRSGKGGFLKRHLPIIEDATFFLAIDAKAASSFLRQSMNSLDVDERAQLQMCLPFMDELQDVIFYATPEVGVTMQANFADSEACLFDVVRNIAKE